MVALDIFNDKSDLKFFSFKFFLTIDKYIKHFKFFNINYLILSYKFIFLDYS